MRTGRARAGRVGVGRVRAGRVRAGRSEVVEIIVGGPDICVKRRVGSDFQTICERRKTKKKFITQKRLYC